MGIRCISSKLNLTVVVGFRSEAGGGSWFSPQSWDRGPRRRDGDHDMTQEQKIIRVKAGLLELAKQLGNVSQACKMMGYSRRREKSRNSGNMEKLSKPRTA